MIIAALGALGAYRNCSIEESLRKMVQLFFPIWRNDAGNIF